MKNTNYISFQAIFCFILSNKSEKDFLKIGSPKMYVNQLKI